MFRDKNKNSFRFSNLLTFVVKPLEPQITPNTNKITAPRVPMLIVQQIDFNVIAK